MQQLEAGSGWNAKGQGTSGVASKRKQGPDGGIGAWTVAMEIEGKPTRWKRGELQATWGVEDLIPRTLHSPAKLTSSERKV